MRKLVVFTGAGMSAESGIQTFRDSGGLWEQHDVMEVASIDGWNKNPNLVQEFYNQRRRQLKKCKPNKGHKNLVKLEEYFDVQIITQNVDDLHERAGSKNVLHLHGELTKSRDVNGIVYDIGYNDITDNMYRPDIIWFGENVPLLKEAIGIVEKADEFVVIGSSLSVYPAAVLLDYVQCWPIWLIDPNIVYKPDASIQYIFEKASKGTTILMKFII